MDMRFGTWNVRSLYRAGALDLVTSDRKETFGRPKRRWEDNIKDVYQFGELGLFGSENKLLESPCECGIETPGSISHGVT